MTRRRGGFRRILMADVENVINENQKEARETDMMMKLKKQERKALWRVVVGRRMYVCTYRYTALEQPAKQLR